ncbi:hypothetical protein HYDPIDRAFT_89909 [Hydnomerulius pinastri MD-312]|uniref:PPPDE domain-containing protein n=1 Tax=Hydnomerulius pinastri MD-312 TaxID=994086 RepID=A0A0C9VG19_9AGAM|nr:hypothetical protein HYDPIDRAFT_89909 [Hydnomerulius pinastri MD-312]
MTAQTLSVAHYGHPKLRVKHWSFLLFTADGKTVAYQITGSTTTYEMKEPEVVQHLRSQSYLGRVDVGTIDAARRDEFLQVLKDVNVKRGDIGWNCQNWVIDALSALKAKGFSVQELTLQDLASRLESCTKDSW